LTPLLICLLWVFIGEINNMQEIKLIIRKILWHFSKKDLNAILKYDPLNVLKEDK